MKRIIVTLAIVALALPAFAQEDTDFNTGTIQIGVQQKDSDTISSKFLEYRDIPQGGTADFFRFNGKKGDYRYDFWGKDVTQKDQRYFARVGTESWRLEGNYVGIPHNFGNGGLTLLSSVTETEWLLSDTLQQAFLDGILAGARNYQTVFALVDPSVQEARQDIDVKLLRNRSNLAFTIKPGEGNFDIKVNYAHERRSGTRGNNGTAFGFNNVVETAEPVRYITQDLRASANFNGGWGSGSVGFNYNDFADKFDTFRWDNPFRSFDSTSSNAYLGPYSTPEGPKQGLAALQPSNQAWNLFGAATFKFGPRTRLTADLAFGQWKQNEQPFIPFTTNTVIDLPDGRDATSLNSLPIRNLDGKIDTLALNGFFTTGLGDKARLNVRYRYYDNDNKTPRTRFEEGYVRFDSVWEEIPRITVPFAFTSNLLDAYLTFDPTSNVGLEVGYKYNKIERAYRETEHTTDNTFRGAVDVRGGGVLVRGLYERSSRDFDEYDGLFGEEQSFLCESASGLVPCGTPGAAPEAPANQLSLRRFDQAKRDRDRFGATVQISPGDGKVTLVASYFYNKDKYDTDPVPFEVAPGTETPLGLLEAKYDTFTLEGDFSPSDRATFYAFYTRENIEDFQTGRQSGGTVSVNPADGWTSNVDDKVDSFGGGADFVLAPQKWFLNLFVRYQKVDGNNAFTAGANRGTPEDISAYDDTKLLFFQGNLKYQFAKNWAATLGGFFEDYELDDSQTGQVLFYMPGSFFLNTVNGDYQAWVGYLNLAYNW